MQKVCTKDGLVHISNNKRPLEAFFLLNLSGRRHVPYVLISIQLAATSGAE